MMKRVCDSVFALALLAITSPLLAVALLAIYRQDGKWPLYSPPRIGKGGVPFRMHKLRTMVADADRSHVDTTAKGDPRITPLGHRLRRYKIDELPQLWNIVRGEMSFVGPRPQIEREVALYTEVERGLLCARPGITDFSSIVFADLADIVASHADANIAYNQLVRPWKSRLGLFYIERASLWVDAALVALTVVAAISPAHARGGVARLLEMLHAPRELVEVSRRNAPLLPTPPPGSDAVVQSRD